MPEYPQARGAPLAPGLYIVSTPIGNLRDITLRALDVLEAADLVLAEDTRVSGKLLSAYGLKNRLERYDEHAAERIRPRVLQLLAEGGRIALVSDAGTPLISDPGYRLVREAVGQGAKVIPIPGASSVMAALAVAGLPTAFSRSWRRSARAWCFSRGAHGSPPASPTWRPYSALARPWSAAS
jgi:16S rRNA (cytidine1402-2'-O)-methyltransferase